MCVVVVGGGGGRDPDSLTAVRLVVVGGVVVVPGALAGGPVRVGHRVGAEVRVAQVVQPVEPAQVGVVVTSHSETGIINTGISNQAVGFNLQKNKETSWGFSSNKVLLLGKDRHRTLTSVSKFVFQFEFIELKVAQKAS